MIPILDLDLIQLTVMWHTYILHRPCCPPILALALLWGCDNHVTVCRCQQETGRDDAVHHWQPAATSSLRGVGIHCLVALFGWLGALNYSCLGVDAVTPRCFGVLPQEP